MKTTRGKDTLDVRLRGDVSLADDLAAALALQDRTERATHGFHAYPASLHPDAARDLIRCFGGTRLYDPFCGGGTTLIEAMLAGLQAEGSDANPVAILVSRARTRLTDEETLTAFRSTSRRIADVGKRGQANPPPQVREAVGEWYEPHVLVELEAMRQAIGRAHPEIRPMLHAVWSSILVKTSLRASETSPRREDRHRPRGTAAVLFHKRARAYARQLEAFNTALSDAQPPARVLRADAREPLRGPDADLVVTSPPYPSVYDYGPLQHLRCAWFGWDHGDDEIGARRYWRRNPRTAMSDWNRDTYAWMDAARTRIRRGGAMVVVIGDGLTDRGPIRVGRRTVEIAAEAGLRFEAGASLARPDHARGTARWEHVLAFQAA